MARIFGPCDPTSGDCFNHEDCAYFNDITGEKCSCDCHSLQDKIKKLMSRENFGVLRYQKEHLLVEIRGKELYDLDGKNVGRLL